MHFLFYACCFISSVEIRILKGLYLFDMNLQYRPPVPNLSERHSVASEMKCPDGLYLLPLCIPFCAQITESSLQLWNIAVQELCFILACRTLGSYCCDKHTVFCDVTPCSLVVTEEPAAFSFVTVVPSRLRQPVHQKQ